MVDVIFDGRDWTTMNAELRAMAGREDLDTPERFDFRVQFAMHCMARVRALIVDSQAQELLDIGLGYPCSTQRTELDEAAVNCRRLATSHRGNEGSEALDGGGHAAVSATFGLSRALAGDAWNAAEYAAYAEVYSYAGYAVTDPVAFESEYAWQIDQLKSMLKCDSSLSE